MIFIIIYIYETYYFNFLNNFIKNKNIYIYINDIDISQIEYNDSIHT